MNEGNEGNIHIMSVILKIKDKEVESTKITYNASFLIDKGEFNESNIT